MRRPPWRNLGVQVKPQLLEESTSELIKHQSMQAEKREEKQPTLIDGRSVLLRSGGSWRAPDRIRLHPVRSAMQPVTRSEWLESCWTLAHSVNAAECSCMCTHCGSAGAYPRTVPRSGKNLSAESPRGTQAEIQVETAYLLSAAVL
jgi:hypothetical protein